MGTVIEPVPVTGLAANFSPMPRMAPPPLGSDTVGAETRNASDALPSAGAREFRSAEPPRVPADEELSGDCWLIDASRRRCLALSTVPGPPLSCPWPRSWRRPPHLPLCQAHAPQHRRNGALEDPAVMLRGHKGRHVRRAASNDHAFTRPNSTPCIPSSSVAIVRKMLESCDNRARREKKWENVPPSYGVATRGRRGDEAKKGGDQFLSGDTTAL